MLNFKVVVKVNNEIYTEYFKAANPSAARAMAIASAEWEHSRSNIKILSVKEQSVNS